MGLKGSGLTRRCLKQRWGKEVVLASSRAVRWCRCLLGWTGDVCREQSPGQTGSGAAVTVSSLARLDRAHVMDS